MCDGQDMECFPIKGNGHPISDTDLYTHCSHHTSSRRMGAPNIFPHCAVSWFWPIRFSCLNYTWCIPVFLALSTSKHHSRVGAMKKHRGLCGSAEWPKLPLHLGVVGIDDPRNTCWPSVEKNQPPKSKSTLVFNGFSKHWTVAVIDDTPWWSAYWFDLLIVNIV